MPSVADVWLTVHVNEREVKKEIERGAAQANTRGAGDRAGRDFSSAFNARVKRDLRKDAGKAGGALGGIAAELTGFGGVLTASSRKAGMFRRVLAGVGLATGLLEAPTAALLGTTGALAGAMTAAGAGAGAYGLALKPVVTRVGELMKLQASAAKGSKAAQQQYAALAKTTPPAILQFTKQVQGARKAYDSWAFSLAKPVLRPLSEGLRLVHPVLRAIRPLVTVTASAFGALVHQLGQRIQGGGVERIVNTLLPVLRPSIMNIGHAIGNVVAGLWELIKAFLPFTNSLTAGLAKGTKGFRDWAAALAGTGGFRSLITYWKQNWPLMREGLLHLVKILGNIVGNMAAMTTGGNSRALWIALNPVLALAEKLSTHPALIQALVYLLAIGKIGSRITSVFTALKSGWGTFAGVINKLTGGKISLGMQGAGDTMLVASQNMQRAADTMVAASGAGKAGGAAAGAEGAAAGAATRGAGLRVASGIFAGATVAAVGYLALDWLSKHGQRLATAGYRVFLGRRVGTAAGSIFGGIGARFAQAFKTTGNPIEAAAKVAADAITGKLMPAAQKAHKPVNALAGTIDDLRKKEQALGRERGPISQFSQQGQAAGAAKNALNQYTREIYQNGLRSAETHAARHTLVNDMIAAGVKGSTARQDVKRYTDAIAQNGFGSQEARAARRHLVSDIEDAFGASQQGQRDMKRYTDAVRINGTDSGVTHAARHQLIKDLESSGLTSKEARRLVNKLTDSINAIPTHHHTSIDASATARGKVIAAARAAGRSATDILAFSSNAEGWRVPGYGGGDRWPALLEGGEAVVPKHLTPAVAPFLKAHGVPGFAAGVITHPYSGRNIAAVTRNLPQVEPWMEGNVRDFARKEEVDFMRAAIRRWRNMLGSGWPFPGGRDLSQLRRIDEGQDMQYPGVRPVNVLAILPGTRTSFGGDPGGFGNLYPGLKLDSPVYGFNTIYYGHVHPAGRGGHLAAGDVIGRTFGPSSGGDAAGIPNWLEIGFWPPSWANGPAMHRLLMHGSAGGPGAARGGNWTVGGMARLWDSVGGPRRIDHLMGAIGMAESGGRAWIINSIGATGLWQIYGKPFPGDATNPTTNARMALAKYRSQGLSAWEAYTNGSYRQFMGGGGVIGEPVLGVGRSGRQYVFGERGDETVIPGRHPMRGTEARLESLADVVAALPGMIGSAVADALDGVSRRGAYRSAYSAR